jgi:hypothetical protein
MADAERRENAAASDAMKAPEGLAAAASKSYFTEPDHAELYAMARPAPPPKLIQSIVDAVGVSTAKSPNFEERALKPTHRISKHASIVLLGGLKFGRGRWLRIWPSVGHVGALFQVRAGH